jgi:serine/threonine protein kinase
MIGVQHTISLRHEADGIKKEWEQGAEPNAHAALAQRPELRADKAVVLDLAYEEYCWRCEAGQRPDADEFCDRFPTFRSSVHRLVAAHHWLGENASRIADDVRPVRWPEPGDRLGDLTLLRELGRGAFARVYLAAEESTGGRPVAVKLSAEGAAEARTMGSLAHPHIVPVLSARFEESVGLTAVCMPFLGAATLTDVLDKAYPTADAPPPQDAVVIRAAIRAASCPGDPIPLPSGAAASRPASGSYADAVARIGLQVAEALVCLHGKGLIHRDLKPENVLLNPDGQALLLDFNLSTDARSALTHRGGTLPYMAPEQLRSPPTGEHDQVNAKTLDERLDLFALGVILYELLTGRHAFGAPPAGQPPAKAAPALLERQRKGCTPLRTLNPAVDRRLARLVESCLAFDPARRPASAAALAADLRRYLSLPARVRRGIAGRPWVTAAMAGLALLAAGAAGAEAAKQPPEDVLAYQQGREAYLAGNHAAALQAFNEARTKNPKNLAYLRACAETELRLGEAGDQAVLSTALSDFDSLNKQRPDGAVMAEIGYCFSRKDDHGPAVAWYDKAIDANFTSAGLYNNRAYEALALNQPDNGGPDLDKALQADPNCQAAHYNRAMIPLRQLPRSPVPQSALDDMQQAIAMGPVSPQLYRDAAQLFARAAGTSQPTDLQNKARAVAYLQKACELGTDPIELMEDPVLKSTLGSLKEFQELQRGTGGLALPILKQRLIDPAPYVPE